MKYRATSYVFAVLLSLFASSQVRAAIIHESAGIGMTGVAADNLAVLVVSATRYVGSRFSITNVGGVNVTEIGGHFVRINPAGNGKIFGAIVNLEEDADGNLFPPFQPSTIGANALALTTLDLLGGDPPVSADVRTLLSVFLPMGDYALIFGSGTGEAGLGGAGGNGEMTDNNVASGAFNPSPPSFFATIWPTDWTDGFGGAPPNFYFVVEGTVVPLPPAFGLFAAGLLALGFIVLRRKRAI